MKHETCVDHDHDLNNLKTFGPMKNVKTWICITNIFQQTSQDVKNEFMGSCWLFSDKLILISRYQK